MKIKDDLPVKHMLIKLYLKDGTDVLCRAFGGGSGVYSIETEDYDDNRYWCQGELAEGYSLDDIDNCSWEYVDE